MGLPIQRPLVGQVAFYEGVYRPHWEIAHIRVRIRRTRKRIVGSLIFLAGLVAAFGVGWLPHRELWVLSGIALLCLALPREEQWLPHFPEGFAGLVLERGGRIAFEGEVSARGRYGHRGSMDRIVRITKVVRPRVARKRAAADRPRE